MDVANTLTYYDLATIMAALGEICQTTIFSTSVQGILKGEVSQYH
jgi:hypothetical protein